MKTLAPYAIQNHESNVKKHLSLENNSFLNFENSFEQDKMSIIFSESFKRLANKTQVFSNDKGSNGHKYRTRLTHSLEVAQLSYQVASIMGLNPIVAEILGMAHDIGHPPFGHKGQDALNEVLMKSTNGKESFEHNNQAHRIFNIIEKLNISPIILDGLKKRPEHGLITPNNYGESQVMNVVDSIAYVAGDTQDALSMESLTVEKLMETKLIARIYVQNYKNLEKQYGIDNLLEHFSNPDFLHKALISHMTKDLIEYSFQQINKHKIISKYDFMDCEEKVIAHSEECYNEIQEFKNFLLHNVYQTEEMKEQRNNQSKALEKLFYFFLNNPDKLGSKYLNRYKNGICSLERTIVDYLSGCEDKYINQLIMD